MSGGSAWRGLGCGFWASQQMVSARAALLTSWVGLLAPFRGITEILSEPRAPTPSACGRREGALRFAIRPATLRVRICP